MSVQYRHRIFGLLLLASLFGSTSAAEEAAPPRADGTPVAMEVFKGPRAIDLPPPFYPESERLFGNEGWVNVNFMIDPHGKPYEVTVVDSTGNAEFEKAAVKSVQKWTFQPAMLGDKAIDTGQNYKLTFAMSTPADGASRQFVRAYTELAKAITAGDRPAADAALPELEVRNLYEDAYKSFVRYLYHLKWGTESQQLTDLKRAVAREKSPRYLRKEMFVAALNAMLALQVKTQDFGGAMETWKILQKADPKRSVASWQSTIDEVQALRTNDRAYRVSGSINKGTSWFLDLYKSHFQVAVSSGQVHEIKLRCEKQYLIFHFEPGVEYKVENRSGDCELELVGDPGTSFDLIQS